MICITFKWSPRHNNMYISRPVSFYKMSLNSDDKKIESNKKIKFTMYPLLPKQLFTTPKNKKLCYKQHKNKI